jgi:hypothetical protein
VGRGPGRKRTLVIEEEAIGTDRLFIPLGIIIGAAIAVYACEGILRPFSFWAPEAAGYFVSVYLTIALRPPARSLVDVLFVALSLLASAVWVAQITSQ